MERSMAQHEPDDDAPSLWEITCESEYGHRTVIRVWADSEEDARDSLPEDAPEVVKITRTEVHGD